MTTGGHGVWIGVLLLAAVAAPARAGEYRTVDVEALRITIDSEWATRTAPGYLPVRFEITNLGDRREVELRAYGNRFFRMRGGGQGSTFITRLLQLARGDRVRLTMPVPLAGDNESFRFEVLEDGRTLESFNFVGLQSKLPPDDAAALIVVEPGGLLSQTARGLIRTSAGPTGPMMVPAPSGGVVTTVRPGSSGPSAQPIDFVLPPDRLPDNWIGFTSLRAVLLGEKEWAALNEAQRTALLTWTACGGDLFYLDATPGAPLPTGQSAPPAAQPVRAYFFGRIHLTSAQSLAAQGLQAALSSAAALQDANWALPANRASDWGMLSTRGFRLPIPGIEGIPARAYLVILIVFSILIGPVNYWVMWRLRQQVLLVLTTPILAVLFIVLLAGYVVAGEGLGVRGRAVTFTMLDQVRRAGATRASVSLYAAGMTPRAGLRFARDEAVFALGSDGIGNRNEQTLDLTEAQRFAAGLINARAPTNLEFIGFRPVRERLTFAREGKGLAVVNALGATVTALIYREGEVTYSLSAPLPHGQRVALQTGAPAGADIVPGGLPLTPRLEHLFDHPPAGSYLAVLDRSPFWNPGVPKVDERGSFHVVIGWVGGQP